MRKALFILIILSVFVFSGCATWSTSNVKKSQTMPVEKIEKAPRDIIITEKDITDKKYKILGDIEVTVNKSTIFHSDPTPQMVNEKLQKEATKLGADAVVLVRYGTVGVSFVSWGSLNGKGRAIAFIDQ